MANKPVMAIQLYTLRNQCQTAEDFDSTLARLAAMGVKDVQISGIGDIPADVQREILDKNGMKVCVTHKDFGWMKSDLPGVIAHHRTIGCDAIGIGSMPNDCRDSLEAVKGFIRDAEKVSAGLREAGMTFQYHNHDFEFKPLEDGKNIMDVLIGESDPELFHFIPDVAWIHYARFDPVEVLKRMKGRIKVLHFKDYIRDGEGKRRFVSLGKGVVNLKACYETAWEEGIPFIAYEQDDGWTDGDPFKATEESWEFMQSLLK